jgi:hypothetical protein
VPQKKFRHLFEIPEIDLKSGLFVIDFISNGYSSRAVIKKGSLSIVYRVDREGYIYNIIDENTDICKTPDTAIWWNNQYFKADEDGKIVIPYAPNYISSKAVLLSKGIADITPFSQGTEEYRFTCFYTLHHESLLINKNATLIISPTLEMYNTPVDMTLLRNCEVKVTMRSYIDDLPMTKTFDNLEFLRTKDVVVNFQVPPNLESLSVTVSADVTNVTKGKCEKLNSSYYFSMNTHKLETMFFEGYLRRINGEYFFFLYDKAGEPIKSAEIDTITINSLVSGSKTYSDEFETDKEGKIKLGSLEEVCWITISGKKEDKSFSCNYNLPYENESYYFPYEMQYLEGEEILIPYIHSMFNSGCVSLLKLNSCND